MEFIFNRRFKILKSLSSSTRQASSLNVSRETFFLHFSNTGLFLSSFSVLLSRYRISSAYFFIHVTASFFFFKGTWLFLYMFQALDYLLLSDTWYFFLGIFSDMWFLVLFFHTRLFCTFFRRVAFLSFVISYIFFFLINIVIEIRQVTFSEK